MSDTNQLIRQGIAAFKAGDKQRASSLLRQAVREDSSNQLAWLWLSGCVESIDEKRECLVQVLTIGDDTDAAQRARKGLEQLAKLESEQSLDTVPDTSTQRPAAKPQPAQAQQQKPGTGACTFNGLLLVILSFGCGWLFWIQIVTPSGPWTPSSPSAPTERSGATITYIAAADGLESVKITYLNAARRDATTYQSTPWTRTYYMSSGMSLRMTVEGPEGVGCAIMIGNRQVAEEYGTGIAICRARVP
jgi:hypothetical protein